MIIRKYFVILGLCTVLAPRHLSAQKVGTSSMQFLKVMPTARATAMGDAYVSLASGADAVFWNPAGITATENIQASGTFVDWLFGTKQSALALTVSLGNWGTIGGQFQYVNYGTIEETRVDQLMFVGSGADFHYNPGLTGKVYSPSALLVGISYAKKLTNKFSTGFSLKYAYESLWNDATFLAPDGNGGYEEVNTSTGVVLYDFGMQYNTGFKSIVIGVSIQNFGAQVKFAKEAFPSPLAFRIGASADLVGPNAVLLQNTDHRLSLAYDIFQPNDYAQQMHFGFEYELRKLFALRAGYKAFYDNDGLTFGIGLIGTTVGIPLRLDYSIGIMGDYLPSVQRLSLGVEY